MSGRLIRCTVRTPERLRCGCPVRWDDALGWVHAPELETDAYSSTSGGVMTVVTTTAELVERHRVHVEQCLHMARVPEELDLNEPGARVRARQGRWIKRRSR